MAKTVAHRAPYANPSPLFVLFWLCVIAAEALAKIPDAPRATWRPTVLAAPGAEPEVCLAVTARGNAAPRALRRALVRGGFAVGSDPHAPRVLLVRGPTIAAAVDALGACEVLA